MDGSARHAAAGAPEPGTGPGRRRRDRRRRLQRAVGRLLPEAPGAAATHRHPRSADRRLRGLRAQRRLADGAHARRGPLPGAAAAGGADARLRGAQVDSRRGRRGHPGGRHRLRLSQGRRADLRGALPGAAQPPAPRTRRAVPRRARRERLRLAGPPRAGRPVAHRRCLRRHLFAALRHHPAGAPGAWPGASGGAPRRDDLRTQPGERLAAAPTGSSRRSRATPAASACCSPIRSRCRA